MAKITVSYDTVSKAMTLDKDGSEMKNCVGVSLGRRWDDEEKHYCDIMQAEVDKDNDIVTYIRTSANEKGELSQVNLVSPVAEAEACQKEITTFFAKQ